MEKTVLIDSVDTAKMFTALVKKHNAESPEENFIDASGTWTPKTVLVYNVETAALFDALVQQHNTEHPANSIDASSPWQELKEITMEQLTAFIDAGGLHGIDFDEFDDDEEE
jgi:hypothetical protein